MPNGWRTINSLVHKIRLHGRRGKGMAESFSRQKSRHAPQKEGGLKILCDLPPVWPRLVRPTNLMSRMDGKKTHKKTHGHGCTCNGAKQIKIKCPSCRCNHAIHMVLFFERNSWTRLDLLSIPQSREKNVKTFRRDHRLQIQNLFMAFKRVPRW